MKRFFRKHRERLVLIVAYPLLMALMRTVRINKSHEERMEAVAGGGILCGLHARGIVAAYIWKRLGFWVLVSLSRDGEMQNKLYTKLGHRTVRGSTGRGGVKATIEAIRMLRSGRERLIIAIDGPRGPRGHVQEGALLMARKSGAALIPVGVSCNPRKTLKTWDNYMIPKPFCRCEVVYGEPIYISENAGADETENVRLQLENAIKSVEREADALSGYQPFPDQDFDPNPVPVKTTS